MTAKVQNSFGYIEIANDVFSKIAGHVVSCCYGVVGLASRTRADGIVSILKKEVEEKGIRVNVEGNNVEIEMRIVVEYGLNIPAICESIRHRVIYYVESCTEYKVSKVNIFVDSIRVG